MTDRTRWPMAGNCSDVVVDFADRLYRLLDDDGWAEHRNCGWDTEPMCGKEWAERGSVLDIALKMLHPGAFSA